MTNFKVFKYFIIAVLFSNFYGCDSLKGILEKNGKVVLDSINQNIDNTLQNDVESLSEKVKNQLRKDKQSLTKDISSIYNKAYVDSLRKILIETGKVKIDVSESFLLKYIKQKSIKDTLSLTNLYLTSPTNGEIKSFEFEVKQGDVVFYKIENLKSNKLKEIAILVGGKTRFVKNNLKKRETVKGSIEITSDNVLTLNISNDNFLKNKGFFKSKLRISLKKISPNLKLKTEIKKDTVVMSKLIIEEKADTIYKEIDSKNFVLEPTLNITKEHKKRINININEHNNLIGWGYWIGIGQSSIDIFNAKSESQNPLVNFCEKELKKERNIEKLPENINLDVDVIIKNESLDARSFNYATNYAFYKSDKFTSIKKNKGEIILTNKSSLYEYKINYYLVAVTSKLIKNEIMKDIVAFKDYMHITLLKDE